MDSTPEQLRFASIPGCTIRADFAGGGLSSDLGPLLLKGVDHQIGLTERACAAINDTRHPGYITHSLHDILKQRIYQIASGYEDGNDCNSLRHDPVFRLGVGAKPFDTDDADGALACGSTISRFEHAVTHACRKVAPSLCRMPSNLHSGCRLTDPEALSSPRF